MFVDAPSAMRQERVARTRGWSTEELARRESAQLSLAEKMQRATDVIRNDASPAELSASVAGVLETILGRGPRASRDGFDVFV